jgi:meiotically up-regulated gene 157 (Mug157) protein
MVSVALQDLAGLFEQVSFKDPLAVLPILAERSRSLGLTIREAIFQYGVVQHPKYGPVFAYEVDGYGGQMLMDDANIPSLLSLPLLGFISKRDPLYLNTRKYVLSEDNPWFFRGSQMEGVGGPHVGRDMVWPMSAMVRARTSTSADEVLEALEMLKRTTADTGLMHESVNKNNATDFTRSWFSWANGLFGETILQVLEEWPEVIEMKQSPPPPLAM